MSFCFTFRNDFFICCLMRDQSPNRRDFLETARAVATVAAHPPSLVGLFDGVVKQAPSFSSGQRGVVIEGLQNFLEKRAEWSTGYWFGRFIGLRALASGRLLQGDSSEDLKRTLVSSKVNEARGKWAQFCFFVQGKSADSRAMKELLDLDYSIRSQLLRMERKAIIPIVSEYLEAGSAGFYNAQLLESFLSNPKMVVLDVPLNSARLYCGTLGQSENEFSKQIGLHISLYGDALKQVRSLREEMLGVYEKVRQEYLEHFGFRDESLITVTQLIDRNHTSNVHMIGEREALRSECNVIGLNAMIDDFSRKVFGGHEGLHGRAGVASMLSEMGDGAFYQNIFRKYCSAEELEEIQRSIVLARRELFVLREEHERLEFDQKCQSLHPFPGHDGVPSVSYTHLTLPTICSV